MTNGIDELLQEVVQKYETTVDNEVNQKGSWKA